MEMRSVWMVLLAGLTLGVSLHAQQSDATAVAPAPDSPAVAAGPAASAGGIVTAPRLIHQADPAYSREAKKKKINGSVRIYCIVDEQGLPQHVRVVKSLGYGLDEAAAVSSTASNLRRRTECP
jgi:outer membrane biosynthesis protein TonB